MLWLQVKVQGGRGSASQPGKCVFQLPQDSHRGELLRTDDASWRCSRFTSRNGKAAAQNNSELGAFHDLSLCVWCLYGLPHTPTDHTDGLPFAAGPKVVTPENFDAECVLSNPSEESKHRSA